MSLNQNIRFKEPNIEDENNPEGLYYFVKPSRWVFNNVNPLPNSGQDLWFYVNTSTGDLFEKLNGVWYLVYNFSTGGGGGGINAIQNDGAGLGLFNNILGSTAHFKSISGASGEIDIVDLTTEAQITINPLYVPPLLSRLVDSRKIGSAPFAPPPSADSSAGFQVGDLWTQQGTPYNIYVCKNPAIGAAEWVNVAPVGAVSFGSDGGIDIFAGNDTVGGEKVFKIRKLKGVSGEIVAYVGGGDAAEIGMSAIYKPATLSKVDNVKNNYTLTTPPTSSDDALLGYQVGSVWSTGTELFICASAAPSAAIWKEIGGSSPSDVKDYIQWTYNGGGHLQVINLNFADFNAGPNPPQVKASLTGTNFSSSFDGVRQVFTRGISSADKAYRVSFSLVFYDSSIAATNNNRYEIQLIRKADGSNYGQSITGGTIYPNNTGTRYGYINHSFIIKEADAAARSYYLQIRGRRQDNTAAPNIQIEWWTLSFDEI